MLPSVFRAVLHDVPDVSDTVDRLFHFSKNVPSPEVLHAAGALGP